MKKGFSLIETLVATAIIVLAAVGPLRMAGTSLSQANYIKDQIVATFLAQEGLEIMRNIRDSSDITAIGNLKSLCGGSNSCTVSGIDSHNTGYEVTQCTNNACPTLDYDTENNLYCYKTQGKEKCPGQNVSSIFTRTVTIQEVVPGSEYKVHSLIQWKRGYGPRTIELTENLFKRTW